MYPWVKILLLAASFAVLAGCSAAYRSVSAAKELEAQGRYEEAMLCYAEALKNDPDLPEYRLRFLSNREKAAQVYGSKGDALYASKNYRDAVIAYQTASGLDGGTTHYIQKAERASQMRDAQTAWQEGQELERTRRLREAARAYTTALELDPGNPEYRKALQRLAASRKSRLDTYDLKLKSTTPFTLKLQNASLREVFAVVSRLSGINFIFDDAVKAQPVTIHLENATFQQSLELLSSMFKLGRKTLNESTVLIYPQTPEKAKQYEEMVVRTFNLKYLDGKKAINLVRSLLQVRKLYVVEETNALVLRDTAEVAGVVEKILEANDLPDAEVVLEVEVVEFNSTDAQNVGLMLSNYSVTLGTFSPQNKLLSPYLYPSNDMPTPVGSDQLLKAFSIKGFGGYVTVPNATYNFGKTLAKGEVLANPKLRVKNKEKAKFNVGQRIPIQTVSSTGTISSTNVQYVDVGIKVNAEPIIQLSNEVTVKLTLEASTPIKRESAGDGTTLLTIGTRNLETVLSLKDGETAIIGGLIQNNDTTKKTKVFLLGDLPLLGPFLSNNESTADKNELIMAITPRLVRRVTVPSASMAAFHSGREDSPTVGGAYSSFLQESEYQGEAEFTKQPGVLNSAPPFGTAPNGVAAVAQTTPAAAQPAVAVPLSSGGNHTGKATLAFKGPASVAAGSPLQLDIAVSDVELLDKAAFTVEYDPDLIAFTGATEGNLLKRGGTTSKFQQVLLKPGSINISIQRDNSTVGVTGEGGLASLSFAAKKPGPARFSFSAISFIRQDGSPQPVIWQSSFVNLVSHGVQ